MVLEEYFSFEMTRVSIILSRKKENRSDGGDVERMAGVNSSE